MHTVTADPSDAADLPVPTDRSDLIRMWLPVVHGVCLRMLGHASDADDATQAVFLVLLRRHALPPPDHLPAWLHRTAVLTCRTQLRARRRRRRWEQRGSDATDLVTSGAQEDAHGLRAQVDAALATLSAPQRAAVVARYLQGMTRAQAAAALGCPPKTLDTRMAAGCARLRRALRRVGIAAEEGAIVAVLAPAAVPTVPAALMDQLLRAARRPPRGRTLVPGSRGLAAGVLMAVAGVSAWALWSGPWSPPPASSLRASAPVPVAPPPPAVQGRIIARVPGAHLLDLSGWPLQWSADGRRLLYWRTRPTGAALVALTVPSDTDGGPIQEQVVQALPGPAPQLWFQWSVAPGRVVAMVMQPQGSPRLICCPALHVDGQPDAPLTVLADHVEEVCAAPDGRGCAWRTVGHPGTLHVLGADGIVREVSLPPVPDATAPDWIDVTWDAGTALTIAQGPVAGLCSTQVRWHWDPAHPQLVADATPPPCGALPLPGAPMTWRLSPTTTVTECEASSDHATPLCMPGPAAGSGPFLAPAQACLEAQTGGRRRWSIPLPPGQLLLPRERSADGRILVGELVGRWERHRTYATSAAPDGRGAPVAVDCQTGRLLPLALPERTFADPVSLVVLAPEDHLVACFTQPPQQTMLRTFTCAGARLLPDQCLAPDRATEVSWRAEAKAGSDVAWGGTIVTAHGPPGHPGSDLAIVSCAPTLEHVEQCAGSIDRVSWNPTGDVLAFTEQDTIVLWKAPPRPAPAPPRHGLRQP